MRSKSHRGWVALSLGAMALSSGLRAEGTQIRFEQNVVQVRPGEVFSLRILLENASQPVAGYSLNVMPTAQPLVGSLTPNLGACSFVDSRNLITAGGGVRDPFFSIISGTGGDGVFFNTVSQGLAGFLPAPGVNDVLAEVVFGVSLDAAGSFDLGFGGGTVLSTPTGQSISFLGEGARILVVPSAGGVGAISILLGGLGVGRRRRG